MRYYGTPDYKIAHFPFNFHFLKLWDYPTVKEFDFRIQSWFKKMPAHGVANWSVSKVPIVYSPRERRNKIVSLVVRGEGNVMFPSPLATKLADDSGNLPLKVILSNTSYSTVIRN